MDTYYINLASAEARRRLLEESFRQCGNHGGRLNRVDALDARYIAENAIPGKIRDTEKACFLSHRYAIDLSRRDEGFSLIVEDDAQFGPSTFRILRLIGEALDAFDIVFTDLVFGAVHDMFSFFLMRRNLMRDGVVKVLDLNEIPFFTTTAYVVNSRSKEKILALIDNLPSYELAYDVQLQKWVETGCLKAGFAFPFLTTVSSQGDYSTIRARREGRPMDMAVNAYRRLVWRDCEQTEENPVEALSELDAGHFDVRTLHLAQILAVLLR
jgi:GR25 family glycosyltransferase involved in LPS biosynthesis